MPDNGSRAAEGKQRAKRVENVRFYNICFLLGTALLVYGLYINVILGLNRGAVIPQPFEPPCQNQCVVNVPLSSVQEFNSFSLDRSHAVFVHFHAINLSLQSSSMTDILDPLNLVWGESIEAPILSLDLGFNAYSFTTLSRMIHHMKVKIKAESLSCLQSLNNSCLTAIWAKSFLGTVTKGRGVLCYAVNDTNTVNYRCCKEDVRSRQVECDIPADLSPEMTAIFVATAIAAAFAILYFPAIFSIFPDKENSETLSSNTQVHNPLFEIGIRVVQAIRHSSEHYHLDVIRKFLIGFTFPILYYMDLGLTYHTKNYDIPQMFNDCVKEFWAKSKIPVLTKINFLPLWLIILAYVVVALFLSFLPNSIRLKFSSSDDKRFAQIVHSIIQEEDHKVNWLTPCTWSKKFGKQLKSFKKRCDSICHKTFMPLVNFALLVLYPVVTILIFIGYALYTSPLGNTICPILNHARIYYQWIISNSWLKLPSTCKGCVFRCFLSIAITAFLEIFVLALAIIFKESLLLSSRFLVYLWMGLVASKDYYFPRIAFISVFVYYSWDCVSSVASRYQSLLQQTFEKCQELQGHPNIKKVLKFDDKGVPRISSQLYQNVIDEILPRSETYTNMILKLTMIVLFLCLTFFSILVFGISNLDQSTKALAVLMTALVPKLVEIFGETSHSRQLCELENACRVERIVEDFLKQNDNGASEKQIGMNQDENQPSSADVHSSKVHVQIRGEFRDGDEGD